MPNQPDAVMAELLRAGEVSERRARKALAHTSPDRLPVILAYLPEPEHQAWRALFIALRLMSA